MKKYLHAMGIIFLVVTLSLAAPAPVKVNVLKSDVNLRAKPKAKAEVVGQVSKNDRLLAKSMGKEWVEVAAPQSVNLWVLSDYVDKPGNINCNNVNVRAGPGINYSIIGQFGMGDKVQVRGKDQEWIRIAAPTSFSLWISRSLVEIVKEKKAPPPPKKPVPQPVKKPVIIKIEPPKVKTVKPKRPVMIAPSPVIPASILTTALARAEYVMAKRTVLPEYAPPDDLVLDPNHERSQGKWAQYHGMLRRRSYFLRTPSKYRLVVYDKLRSPITRCFIKGNVDQLETLLNRSVTIGGRVYWLKGYKYPLLIPERIVLR